MKRILRLLSEPHRKRLASAMVRNQAELLNALAGNAQLHRWLRGQRVFQYFPCRYDLYVDIRSKTLGDEPIDYLEFGVREGDSLFKWSTINTHPNSRFIGFDSFEGILEDWASVTGVAPKGSFSVEGVVPQTNDSRIRFVKGWFNDTLRPFLQEFRPCSRLVIHNDGPVFIYALYAGHARPDSATGLDPDL